MRRIVILLVVAVLLIAAGAAVWSIAALPPPALVLACGATPACEPAGRRVVLEGVEFVEIGPGIFRMGSDALAKKGDLLGRISSVLGLAWGLPAEYARSAARAEGFRVHGDGGDGFRPAFSE